ncbi:penicillin-binding protein [Corynebacterium sp. CCUG 71335]|nr:MULTISPECIES: transglycosylase domain-containing protein [unclassified Corynebacterium]MCQ4619111.1 penicillin-binding protein [Corynebacterium pseudogenitalium]MCQ4620119.1 penicillin-binding protein [Corynebacterium sp. CCUG 71335]MCQ4623082.1 penicillin-binding protein [Corynebacterium sp. CCUG 70398]MCQ4624295.1 penicillin-binding protein [Corynebacterium sp. CCUG 69979]
MARDTESTGKKPEPKKPTQKMSADKATADKASSKAGAKTGTKPSEKDSSTRVTKKKRRRGQWLAALALAVVLLLLVPLTIFGVNYAKADLPQPGEIDTPQISTIFYNDGQKELARLVPPEGNREQIALDQVPEHVQNAVFAAEDRDFWDNSGFSFTGFGRALLGQLTGNDSAGGGSTITQQYVKNTIVGNERSYTRKFNELVYSIKMTRNWSKEEILTGYLNTIYFGRNAYGIEAAAHAYFSKPAAELSVEEGALLAGLIQLPSQLDPWNNPDEAQNRWDYVLDGMVDQGWLSADERAGAQFPDTRDPETYSAYTEATGPNGLIKNQVIRELEQIGISEADVTNRGLQIKTTIDPHVQQQILDTAETQMATLQEDARTGVVAIDPKNGEVRGYYGGDDPSGWDYADAGLQTGSTFKIFGLAAALQQGIPLSAPYDSSPVTVGSAYITNSGGGGGGMTSMADALKNSYNTSFIRIQSDLDDTTNDTKEMAHALGVARQLPNVPETLTEHGEQPLDGIILGQYQSRVLDMATGVSTLINRGVWHPTHFVQQVTSADGEVLYEFDPEYKERRVNSQVADNVVQAMQPVAGWSHAALAGGRPSAAKTGTVQLGNTGLSKDAWMVGGTPELSVAVWVGTADNTTAIYNSYGGTMFGAQAPAQIWKGVLDGALDGKEYGQFPDAKPINWGVDPYSGGTYGGQKGYSSQDTSYNYSQPSQQRSAAPEPQAPAASAPPPAPAPAPAPPQAPEPAPEPPPSLGEILDELVQ